MARKTIQIETDSMEVFRGIDGRNDTERFMKLLINYTESNSRADLVLKNTDMLVIAMAQLNKRMEAVENMIYQKTGGGY